MDSGELSSLIGERVRTARAVRKFSLATLARLASVGKGSLSEIENGTRNPTLSTLYALARALEVPLSWLLADRVGAEVQSPGITARLLDSTACDGVTIEVYILRLDPGPPHVSEEHGSGVVEHLVLTRGLARVGKVGDEVMLVAGEAATWIADSKHSYQALGDDVAEGVLVMRWQD
ncbi:MULTISPECIES: helix-turn-helix domain-containing protein [Rhodococcus]|uniref:XRE family transcriptional regulator n=1 Tax=Rhodococcus pyridinivorans SB3094 TaxID=1435356 RepID=V9XHG1_9NOCA|nr:MULTISPECIES: XRE family transcriptional regulator [Rhodococcus]AHD21449.1 XRE family transcriptional regulator [Rhodococcus pyridinivorans SB3094]MCT7291052.1 XRE family transcriptional regulator [Rhodococcus sp. PAE-6]USI89952.1 XRE family transcriptional regulator [Rhodococcus pyridinivorans]